MKRVLLTALLLACSYVMVPRVSEGQSIEIREEWATTGSESSGFLGAISGMAELSSETIWISDPRADVIWALDSDGTNMRVVARNGDGPGEIRGPSLLTSTPAGGIAAFDIRRSTIELFRSEGEFERRIQLPLRISWPKGLAVLADTSVVISGGVMAGRTGTVFRIRADGSIAGEWVPAPKATDPRARMIVSGGPVSALPSGGFVFSQAAPHAITLFNNLGAKRTFAADPELLAPVGDDAVQVEGTGSNAVTTFRGQFPQSRLVHFNPDGTILNVVRNAEAGWSLWEWYEPSGQLIVRVRSDRAYDPFTVCKDGDVLAYYVDAETAEFVATRLAVSLKRQQ